MRIDISGMRIERIGKTQEIVHYMASNKQEEESYTPKEIEKDLFEASKVRKEENRLYVEGRVQKKLHMIEAMALLKNQGMRKMIQILDQQKIELLQEVERLSIK